MNPQQTQDRIFQPVLNLAEIVVQSTARLINLQAAAARALLQTQMRSSALRGAPDLSHVFASDTMREISELFTAGAEESMKLMRQTNETIGQLQKELSDAFMLQTEQWSEQIRKNVQDIEQRTQQAVLQVREVTQRERKAARETAEQSETALQGSGVEARARGRRGG